MLQRVNDEVEFSRAVFFSLKGRMNRLSLNIDILSIIVFFQARECL